MLSQDKKEKLQDDINLYHLYDWLEINTTGFNTQKTGSGRNLWQILLLLSGMFFLMYMKTTDSRGRQSEGFGWFIFFFVLCLLAIVIMTLGRKAVFDLEKREVRLMILGSTTFQASLDDFEKFSFDPGFIVNGVDPGGILYMHFKKGRTMRLVQVRNPNDLANLQDFILETIKL